MHGYCKQSFNQTAGSPLGRGGGTVRKQFKFPMGKNPTWESVKSIVHELQLTTCKKRSVVCFSSTDWIVQPPQHITTCTNVTFVSSPQAVSVSRPVPY